MIIPAIDANEYEYLKRIQRMKLFLSGRERNEHWVIEKFQNRK
jgi:hypothetical protein